VVGRIRAGAERVGRTLSDLDLQVGGAVAFGDDLESLIAPLRPALAFTLGAMGSRRHNFYNDAFRRAGFEEAATRVQALWLEGRRGDAAAAVPDEMVLAANLLGTEEMVRARIRAYRDAGVGTLRVAPAGSTLDERLDTLGRAVQLVREASARDEGSA
jgi:alkanesulfonate monooxygenase SsuD/methylene tetrahydromethanopterin reductase-like flavin-dependent oxidoreductase (luciferase family)